MKNGAKNNKTAVSQAAADASTGVQAQSVRGVMLHEQQHIKTIFDPDVVRQYATLVPDAPERILAQFEKNNSAEREYRQLLIEQQNTVNRYQSADNSRRDWMAFALMVAVLAFAVVCAVYGFPWLAGGSLAGVFVAIGIGYFKWRK